MAGRRLKALASRVYADFFMGDRLAEFRLFLEEALARGYAVQSLTRFWEAVKDGGPAAGARSLILRNDVDTDPGTAREMWAVATSLGGRGSWYFRLSTMDVGLMREIHASGSEASYHYEELATCAKREGLRTRDEVLARLGAIRNEFATNLARLREATGLPMTGVASHGDWLNRRLGVTNTVILADEEFRRRVGVELEVYDDALMRWVNARSSDMRHPVYWTPASPLEAIWRGERVVYVLVHPRWWVASRRANVSANWTRMGEGLRYALRGRTTGTGRCGRASTRANLQ